MRKIINEEVSELEARRQKIREAEVLNLRAAQVRKKLKEFERLIAPFFTGWDESLPALIQAKELVPETDKAIFEKLLADYRHAATDLSVFLRGTRLRMMREK